ncbi:MAG TPA: hypothetical protein VIM62_11100 [Acidobacteriaceae bacterium]
MTGCGGSGKSAQTASTTYTIGGTVSGVTGSGLVLQNNGANNLTVAANATSFAFPTPIASGGVYSVTILTQPAGESCIVSNGAGKPSANVSNVSVTCAQQYTIGGTIQGLTGPGLVLQNNSGDNLGVDADSTSFTFPTPLVSGSAYSITILTQPAGEQCAISNGSGKASATVTNVSILCSQLYGISGSVAGLHRAGLVIEDNGGDQLTVPADATSFTFATPLALDSTYNITILAQPQAESCSISNGAGTVSAAVINAGIVCTGEWSWTAGSSTVGLAGGSVGSYGTIGVASETNIPGGREQSGSWKDASGNIWLMGGNGEDATGTAGLLNDLWRFNPSQGTGGEWTWVAGSNIAPLGLPGGIPNGQPGVYGKLGHAAPTNAPGGREQMTTWIDSKGDLWLFGGLGIDSIGTYGYLNDLWEFDPTIGSNGEWIWMAGSSTVAELQGASGVYGTLGIPSAKNIPGGRYGGYAWTDPSGSFWLFGGNGFDSVGTNAYLNDLWKYAPGANGAVGEWTWIGGPSVAPRSQSPFSQSAAPGIYGKQGSSDPANIPGGRSAGVTWIDASGNLWLFGGLGADSADATGYLNDLWKYSPGAEATAGEWTWMSGSDVIGTNGGQPGVYGVKGVGDAANTPGARFSPSTWVDSSGNLWLFGGQGYDWTGAYSGILNDLWEYVPSADNAGRWAWMGGSDLIPPNSSFGIQSGQPGVYGTLGSPSSANTPGARIGATPWVDASGNLWLFGGFGNDSTNTQGYMNDLWKYQP